MKRQLLIDLETSALNPIVGEIIRFRGLNLWNSDDEFDEWVRPQRALCSEAENIVGTTNEMLRQCRPIEAVLPEFLNFIDGAELIGDTIDFDLNFLDYLKIFRCL
jgi:DNA polymerase III alpha subunit (gram-positive type)